MNEFQNTFNYIKTEQAYGKETAGVSAFKIL
jgi:hypothetical protein